MGKGGGPWRVRSRAGGSRALHPCQGQGSMWHWLSEDRGGKLHPQGSGICQKWAASWISRSFFSLQPRLSCSLPALCLFSSSLSRGQTHPCPPQLLPQLLPTPEGAANPTMKLTNRWPHTSSRGFLLPPSHTSFAGPGIWKNKLRR